MTHFLNYKNGTVTIETYRDATAIATDVDDILDAVRDESDECLCACLGLWIKDELEKVEDMDPEDAANFIFGIGDFLSNAFDTLGLDLGDYPELREQQHDFIAEMKEEA